MKNGSLLLMIALVLHSAAFAAPPARPPQSTEQQAQDTTQDLRVRGEVQKRGVGEKSRVKVRLRNATEVRGYISQIDEASFAVTDSKTGQATTIPYADVQKIRGPGLPLALKIVIIAGVVAGVMLVSTFAFIAAID